jgi:hypothetical protein
MLFIVIITIINDLTTTIKINIIVKNPHHDNQNSNEHSDDDYIVVITIVTILQALAGANAYVAKMMGNPVLGLFPFLRLHKEGRKDMAVFHAFAKKILNEVRFLDVYEGCLGRQAPHL